MKIIVIAACLAPLLVVNAFAGPPPPPAAAIAARKANFKEIGGSFKTIKDEIASGQPDMRTVKLAARDLSNRAAGQLANFPRGSGPESGSATRSQPAIWTSPQAFMKLQNDMVLSAKALDAAAQSGNIDAMKTAHQALGRSCKSCHDQFRTPQ